MQSRSTHQKKVIYDYIVNSKSHPSINKIYQDLLEKGENIGIATCYRNLKSLLNEKKVIQIMTSDNVAHFDYIHHNHYHLVCSSCHDIIDMDANSISLDNENSLLKSFKVDIKDLVIYGTCKKCQEKEKN